MCSWQNDNLNFSSPRLMLLLLLSIITQTDLQRIFFFLKWGTGRGFRKVSTWSFITWAGVWKDHWFAHAAGWHWPEASDHWLGSAGLIIYLVAYCLHRTAFLSSSQLFYNAGARRGRMPSSTDDALALSSHPEKVLRTVLSVYPKPGIVFLWAPLLCTNS